MGNLYFLSNNFGIQFIPLKIGEIKKNSSKGENIAKTMH